KQNLNIFTVEWCFNSQTVGLILVYQRDSLLKYSFELGRMVIQMIHFHHAQADEPYIALYFLHQAIPHNRRSRINSQDQSLLSLFLYYHIGNNTTLWRYPEMVSYINELLDAIDQIGVWL